MRPFTAGIVLYPDCDLLDVAGPNEILSFFGELPAGKGLTVVTVGATSAPIPVVGALSVVPQYGFGDAPVLDLLFVPGGGSGIVETIADEAFLAYLRQAAAKARYITSVCTGGILLAAAGLLDGYAATTHWAVIDSLRLFPKVNVVNGCPRYVRDRNRITGGGISSSIDVSLFLVQLLATDFTGEPTEGDRASQAVQLMIQYHPRPPFEGGDPCSVDYALYAPVVAGMGPFRAAVAAAVEAHLHGGA